MNPLSKFCSLIYGNNITKTYPSMIWLVLVVTKTMPNNLKQCKPHGGYHGHQF